MSFVRNEYHNLLTLEIYVVIELWGVYGVQSKLGGGEFPHPV